jgi:hypothetical protein
MKTVKLVNNESGFDCTGCIYDTSGNGCGATAEALKIGDCDIDIVFREVQDDIAK